MTPPFARPPWLLPQASGLLCSPEAPHSAAPVQVAGRLVHISACLLPAVCPWASHSPPLSLSFSSLNKDHNSTHFTGSSRGGRAIWRHRVGAMGGWFEALSLSRPGCSWEHLPAVPNWPCSCSPLGGLESDSQQPLGKRLP